MPAATGRARRRAPRSLASRAAYAAYRSGGVLAQAAPGRSAEWLAGRVARALALTLADRRRLVGRHMQRAHGGSLTPRQERAAVRAVFESYARYWVEAFRLPAETPESIDARMYVEGMDRLEAAAAEGNGVVLALPHLGGWDFGGAWLARRGIRPVAVAEVLEPPELFDWFVGWRRRLGIEIVPADTAAGTTVLEAVRAGKTVSLISDRDILGNGVEVEFFGEVTTLPAGPALLALRTGAPLMTGAVYFEDGGGHRGVVGERIEVAREGRLREDVTRITQIVAGQLEAFIRAAPEQWHLMQPNWPSDPGWRSS